MSGCESEGEPGCIGMACRAPLQAVPSVVKREFRGKDQPAKVEDKVGAAAEEDRPWPGHGRWAPGMDGMELGGR